MRRTMNIDQVQEPDYDSVTIDYVGFVDPYAVEGMVVLKADNGKEFHMRAFSGEVAKHISSFGEKEGEAAPSISHPMGSPYLSGTALPNPKINSLTNPIHKQGQ